MFPELGLPSAIDESTKNLPLDEQFGAVKSIDFTKDALAGLVGTGLAATDIIDVDSLRDYADLAKYVNRGDLPLEEAGQWISDVEFGRQMMNGVNPVVIKRCDSIPDNFPVTNEMVQNLLTRGKTLDEEMKVSSSNCLFRKSHYKVSRVKRYISI